MAFCLAGFLQSPSGPWCCAAAPCASGRNHKTSWGKDWKSQKGNLMWRLNFIQKPIWFWCFTIPFESSLKRCNPLATQTHFLVETLAQVTGQPEGYAIYVGHWIEDWNAVSQPKMISRSRLFQSIATQPKLYRIMVHQIKGRTIEIKLYIAYFSLFLMRPCSYILHCHIIARKLPFDFQKR